jgi:hypothetical protein
MESADAERLRQEKEGEGCEAQPSRGSSNLPVPTNWFPEDIKHTPLNEKRVEWGTLRIVVATY